VRPAENANTFATAVSCCLDSTAMGVDKVMMMMMMIALLFFFFLFFPLHPLPARLCSGEEA
jgi:hypothetical protein